MSLYVVLLDHPAWPRVKRLACRVNRSAAEKLVRQHNERCARGRPLPEVNKQPLAFVVRSSNGKDY